MVIAMNYIIKNFFGDLKRNLPQIVTISVIISIGVAFFIGLNSTFNKLNNSITDYYEQSNISDLYAYGNSISENLTNELTQVGNIKDVENRIQITGQLNDSDLVINSYTKHINKTNLIEGRLPNAQSDEIALDHLFMKKNNLKVGDTITVEILGTKKNLKISGDVQSAEYLYQIKDSTQPVPNHKTYGYAFMNKDYLQNRLHLSPNQVLLTTNSSNVDETNKKLQEKYPNLIFVTKEKNISYAMFDSKLKTIKNMAFVLPVIFCVLAILITLISMVRYVENQRQTISIMKAIGHPYKIIYFSILIFPTLTVLLGSIIGACLGILIFPNLLINTLQILFDFPKLQTLFFISPLVTFSLVLLFLENIVTFLTCWKIIQEKPASLLRPKAPKNITHSFIEHFSFWDKLNFGNKLVFFNIKLNKTRFLLSSIGIIFSVCLIISSVGLKFSLSEIIRTEFTSNRKYDINASLSNPYNYKDDIKFNIDSLKSYDPYSVIQAQIESKTTKLNVLNNKNSSIKLVDSHNKEINIDRANGIYISSKLMSELKIKTGDEIKLSIVDLSGKNYIVKVKVSGSYLSYTSQGLYTTFNYLSRKGINIPVSSILIKTKNIKKTAKSISDNPQFSTYTIKNRQKNDYNTASKSINDMIILMIVASALLLFTIIYNISSINIFERTRDIATEKVLGLKNSEISSLILKENLILVFFSTLLGSVISFKFYLILCKSLAPEDMAFPESLNWLSFPISFLLILIFLYTTNLFLKPKIKKINMLDSLKSTE
jgi:hypothetical protein